MYPVLDVFFFVFHTVWILFNLFGWIWEKTLLLNLITLSMTALSWFGLGLWYGLGYCPCTAWHWKIRRELGDQELPNSYIKFLLHKLLGIEVPALIVDVATVTLFMAAFACSLYFNYQERRT